MGITLAVREPAMSTVHKVFVSYHHANDQGYRDAFERMFGLLSGVVQTDNSGAYIKEVLETGQAHMRRLGSIGHLRAWKAKYTGRDAGSVIIAIEFPSLSALAEDEKKTAGDPALSAWIKDLDKIRKIVSDSLYVESKP